jgi:hypothetical protein
MCNASTFNSTLGQHSCGSILNLEGLVVVAMKLAWPCCFHEHVNFKVLFKGSPLHST